MRQASTCLWFDTFGPPCQRVPAQLFGPEQSPDKAVRPPQTFDLAGLDQAFHHR